MRRDILFQILKVAVAAVVFALLFVLAFTLIIQLFSVGDGAIKPVNQVFKIICLALGCIIFIRGEKGLVKGALAGLIYIVATYLLFGAFAGDLAVGWLQLAELALGVFAGGIAGIIAVNIKKV